MRLWEKILFGKWLYNRSKKSNRCVETPNTHLNVAWRTTPQRQKKSCNHGRISDAMKIFILECVPDPQSAPATIES